MTHPWNLDAAIAGELAKAQTEHAEKQAAAEPARDKDAAPLSLEEAMRKHYDR